jgi:hypothetical protein
MCQGKLFGAKQILGKQSRNQSNIPSINVYGVFVMQGFWKRVF